MTEELKSHKSWIPVVPRWQDTSALSLLKQWWWPGPSLGSQATSPSHLSHWCSCWTHPPWTDLVPRSRTPCFPIQCGRGWRPSKRLLQLQVHIGQSKCYLVHMLSYQLGQHISSGRHYTCTDANDVALGWVMLLLINPGWLFSYVNTKLMTCLLFFPVPKQGWWLCY